MGLPMFFTDAVLTLKYLISSNEKLQLSVSRVLT